MPKVPTLISAALICAAFTPVLVVAQTTPSYEDAYAKIVMQMHMDMGTASTGDPDFDFAAGMIPHHAGAVAMAELVLEHGTDPELRAMAETIIATQNAEIAFLEAWIAKQAE